MRAQALFAVALGAALGAASGARAVTYVTQTCEEERDFLQFHWTTLTAQEKALGEAFNKTADLKAQVDPTGKTVVSSCHITWPTENGKNIDGTREAVLDSQWIQAGEPQQHGIRLRYRKWTDAAGNARRAVTTLEVCRTPETCAAMGIPKQSRLMPVETE